MLNHATRGQDETFERLKSLFDFGGNEIIKFTLVGAAACREHGLTRPTKDLDIVVSPYQEALGLIWNSGMFHEDGNNIDSTGRTCTQIDSKTSVPVDFLMGEIRINDGTYALKGGVFIVDRLPIPAPSGFGDIAPVPTLVGMKLSSVISGIRIQRVDADFGVRSSDKIDQDIRDVRSLISICSLGRDQPLGDQEVQRLYRILYDGGDVISAIT